MDTIKAIDLSNLRDFLTTEIIKCNDYLHEKNDFGKTHRADDPHESISFT